MTKTKDSHLPNLLSAGLQPQQRSSSKNTRSGAAPYLIH